MPTYEYALVKSNNPLEDIEYLNRLGKQGYQIVSFDQSNGVYTLCREVDPVYDWDCVAVNDLTEATANGWTFVEVVPGADYADAAVLIRRPVQPGAELKPKVEFSIGDLVVTTKDVDFAGQVVATGEIGKIVERDLGSFDGLEYLIEWKTGLIIWIEATEIRLATAAEKANADSASKPSKEVAPVYLKGDRVAVVNKAHHYFRLGAVATVVNIDADNENPFNILIGTREGTCWVSADDIRPATDDEKAEFNGEVIPTAQFEVGNIVIVTADNAQLIAGDAGKIITIDLGDDDGLEYCISTSRRTGWTKGALLRLATDAEKNAYEVQS